jgi:putative drug exporter of the RND superfamily
VVPHRSVKNQDPRFREKIDARLNEGAAKLRAAVWLEERTGIPLTGSSATTSAAVAAGLLQAWGSATTARASSPRPEGESGLNDPRHLLINELTGGALGAGRIAEGAALARHEVASMLENPVGRRALNRLMITDETICRHPELRRSFSAYITQDGHRSRIDLTQSDRIYSAGAMDQVTPLGAVPTSFWEISKAFTGPPGSRARMRSRLISGP